MSWRRWRGPAARPPVARPPRAGRHRRPRHPRAPARGRRRPEPRRAAAGAARPRRRPRRRRAAGPGRPRPPAAHAAAGWGAGLRGLVRGADLVVAHSAYVAERLRAATSPSPPARPPGRRPRTPAPAGTPPGPLVAVHFGVVRRRYKGTATVTALARAGVPGWTFAVAGAGAPPAAPWLASVAGYVDTGVLLDLVARSDATVLPYRLATQSGSAVLAMAWGRCAWRAPSAAWPSSSTGPRRGPGARGVGDGRLARRARSAGGRRPPGGAGGGGAAPGLGPPRPLRRVPAPRGPHRAAARYAATVALIPAARSTCGAKPSARSFAVSRTR